MDKLIDMKYYDSDNLILSIENVSTAFSVKEVSNNKEYLIFESKIIKSWLDKIGMNGNETLLLLTKQPLTTFTIWEKEYDMLITIHKINLISNQ